MKIVSEAYVQLEMPERIWDLIVGRYG